MRQKGILFLLIFWVFTATSCRKYLDAKSDKKLVIPEKLQDLQAMLDNSYILNTGPSLALTASDEYYLDYSHWNAISSPKDKDSYIWRDNVELTSDWNNLYKSVLYTNTVLDYLADIPSGSDQGSWNKIKGSALFFRSYAFYGLAQVFVPPYDKATASSDPGLPLRLNSDYREKSVRATVQQTYDRMIADLEVAARLLPAAPENVLRPSRPAAYALLARIHLITGDWEKGRAAADSCLKAFNTLLDFNTLNTGAAFPMGNYNTEVIFHSLANYSPATVSSRARLDTVLYESYSENDLRRKAFFSGTKPYSFKGNYYADPDYLFNGLATDEVYLIRAECQARLGQTVPALDDLNTLLEKRWKSGTFTPLIATTANEALSLILQERRKELLMRGTRWSDLRRLNKEPQFAVAIKRVLNGQEYVLPPNDPRYTFLIPQGVINLTGMPQNKR